MIVRVDLLQTELPPPSDPDPVGAAAVQELLGGKFGEMSTANLPKQPTGVVASNGKAKSNGSTRSRSRSRSKASAR